jgi:hypothetical protein
VIRLEERHGHDDVAALAHDARELGDGAAGVLHVLEHRVAEDGIERLVVERRLFERPEDDGRIGGGDVVADDLRRAARAQERLDVAAAAAGVQHAAAEVVGDRLELLLEGLKVHRADANERHRQCSAPAAASSSATLTSASTCTSGAT